MERRVGDEAKMQEKRRKEDEVEADRYFFKGIGAPALLNPTGTSHDIERALQRRPAFYVPSLFEHAVPVRTALPSDRILLFFRPGNYRPPLKFCSNRRERRVKGEDPQWHL